MQRSTPLAWFISRLLVAVSIPLAATGAGAAPAINCTIAPAGTIIVAYVPANAADNISQSSFTMTCTATTPGSAGAKTLEVGAALASGGGPVTNVYRTSPAAGCSATAWGATAPTNTISVAMVLVNGSPVTSAPQSFWNCVVAGQNAFAANTYTSTVTLSAATVGPATNWNLTSAASFNVSVTTPAVCSITSAPANITLIYVDNGGFVSSSTPFSVQCTNNLPYTMAVSPAASTLLGVAYTMTLSLASGTGAGIPIGYTVTASALAGQNADCTTNQTATGCTTTLPHTLTITY